MIENFDYEIIISSLPFLIKGLKVSFYLTFLALIGGIFFGTILALMRISNFKSLQYFSMTYVNFLRSLPLILVIFWFFFLIPVLIGRPIGGFYSAVIAFTMFEAAYYSEIIRAGLLSVSSNQISAARATGLSYSQSMIYIILPQAFRNMIPILLTQAVILFQDTSLVYVVSLRDFMTASTIVAQSQSRLVEMYIFAALIYFVICFTFSFMIKKIQKRKLTI
jgi:glutamate/aspartate transport system permease protein|tara:strand:- start:810 stop:1472 length:663 start_codon:yes stop_codon:yes gene_type:complete